VRLTVLLLTFDRFDYAERTLRTALDNLRWSGDLDVHIADDGSPGDYIARLVEIAGGYGHVRGVTTSNAERRGYGASYNLATQQVHLRADYVIPLEDDWELRRELDCDRLAQICSIDSIPFGDERRWGPGCVRLGYIGFTQPLRGTLFHEAGQTLIEFDPDSPERHVFAGHPRFEATWWQRAVGPWPEGLDPGSTEHEVAGIPAARRGVVWPLDLIKPAGDLFAHIGTIQARHDQREGATA
jgi:hypothetical protein